VVERVLAADGLAIPAQVEGDKGLLQVEPDTCKCLMDSNTVRPVVQEAGILALEWTASNSTAASESGARCELVAGQVQRMYDQNLRVYGADKIWRQLRREGTAVARCTVTELEDYGDPIDPRDPNWLLGDRQRHRGSLHKDIWRGTAAELANRGFVAVYPAKGWWRTRPAQERYDLPARYSLIVSIRTPEADVDLYTPIAEQVAAQAAVPVVVNTNQLSKSRTAVRVSSARQNTSADNQLCNCRGCNSLQRIGRACGTVELTNRWLWQCYACPAAKAAGRRHRVGDAVLRKGV
jgi:hypothetical protein